MSVRAVVAALVAAVAAAGPAVGQKTGAWNFGLPTDPPGKTCGAALRGDQAGTNLVNTRLMRNKQDQMILIAARSDWENYDPVTAKLSINGAAPVDLHAMTLGPMVLVNIEDAALEAKLKAALTLDWTMPWGGPQGSVFHADVAGLGAAYDRLDIC